MEKLYHLLPIRNSFLNSYNYVFLNNYIHFQEQITFAHSIPENFCFGLIETNETNSYCLVKIQLSDIDNYIIIQSKINGDYPSVIPVIKKIID